MRSEKFELKSVESGFTLVELLIVFSFIGILTSLGIAAYSTYSGTQAVQSSANDVATLLNTAKSRSISQVVPSGCVGLRGYQVNITQNGQQYSLSALCGANTQVITTNSLPPQVTFTSASTALVFFPISTGAANTASIVVTGYGGKTQTISVTPTGSVTVN